MSNALVIPGAFLAVGLIATVAFFVAKRRERLRQIDEEFSDAMRDALREMTGEMADEAELDRIWKLI